MKLRQFFAMLLAAMGITTIMVAVVSATPIMIVCGILQVYGAYRIV